jgi:hypothetical protein
VVEQQTRACPAHFGIPEWWRRMRLTANFLKQINLICPVQSRLQKYFGYRFTQISNIPTAIPPLQRGVSRSSRTLVRDAVDAGGALDETR